MESKENAEAKQSISNNEDLVKALVESSSNEVSTAKSSRMRQLKELKDKYLLSMLRRYPPEVCLMRLMGVDFLAKGDIHAIKAKQKQGKTHAIAVMIASLLGCKKFRIQANQEKSKIILFDTEQKPADTQEIYRQVLRLASLPEEDVYDRLQFYSIETMPFGEMFENVKLIIEEEHPDIVFVDGFVDLLEDFNDLQTSKKFVNDMRTIAVANDCAIVGVLHTNKAVEDHNMRGHAGTMLAQKAAQVWECTKDDYNIVTMKCTDYRKSPLSEWSFTWDDKGNLISADEAHVAAQAEAERNKAEQKLAKKQKQDDAKFEIFKDFLSHHQGAIKRSELTKTIAGKIGKNRSTIANQITKFIDDGKLVVVADDYISLS